MLSENGLFLTLFVFNMAERKKATLYFCEYGIRDGYEKFAFVDSNCCP